MLVGDFPEANSSRTLGAALRLGEMPTRTMEPRSTHTHTQLTHTHTHLCYTSFKLTKTDMDGVFGEQISTVLSLFQSVDPTKSTKSFKWGDCHDGCRGGDLGSIDRGNELPYEPYELPIVTSCNVPKVHVEVIKVLGSVTLHLFIVKVSGSAGRCGFLQCDRIKSSLLNPQGRLLVRHGINLVGFYHFFI